MYINFTHRFPYYYRVNSEKNLWGGNKVGVCFFFISHLFEYIYVNVQLSKCLNECEWRLLFTTAKYEFQVQKLFPFLYFIPWMELEVKITWQELSPVQLEGRRWPNICWMLFIVTPLGIATILLDWEWQHQFLHLQRLSLLEEQHEIIYEE